MTETIYFAARRWRNIDQIPQITLVVPTTGVRTPIRESLLTPHQIGLGDFLKASDTGVLKMAYLTTSVIGDVAYVDNIRADLVIIEGTLVFKSLLFSDALCTRKLPLGCYNTKLCLLKNEHKLPSGHTIHFEVVDAVPYNTTPNLPTFTPIPPSALPMSPIPNARSSASPAPSNNSQFGSRASTPCSPIVKGAGFQPKPKNNKKVVGTGFQVKNEKKKEQKVIHGAGFAPPPEKKEDKVIHGAGFEAKPRKTITGRAVVLSINENKNNRTNTHYLWILENQSEGRFISKEYKLGPGHFFEGTFIQGGNGKWNCESYQKQIEKPASVDGGIDLDGKIWFKVTVNNFQPAGGNRRFGKANAKYFGEVLEGELETTKLSAACNGKKVKIQRKGIADKDYVWMVVEIPDQI
uniref:DUF3421 domain-containing protein n=1 Tax=Caenorhabditis tropicalis TaxID=1561998 RepID=A0A1I7UM67_9PELO